MAGGLVQAVMCYVTGKDGQVVQVSPTTPLPGGGGGGGGGGVVTQTDATQLNSQVVGNVANNATDVGNPVKVGFVANSGVPSPSTSGQRTDSWGSAHGGMIIATPAFTLTDGVSNSSLRRGLPSASSASAGCLVTAGYYFNGTTLDQTRGDANGAWNQGNVASGTTDAGMPIKIGAVFNTTLPTFTTGQRGDVQITARGEQLVSLSAAGTALSVAADNSDTIIASSTLNKLVVLARQYVFDGTNNLRARGDTNGAYTVKTMTTAAAGGITPVVAQGGTSLVVKAAAGNFVGGYMIAGATAGFLIAYNAAAAPAAGATLTASLVLGVVPVAANSPAALGDYDMPERFGVGVVLLFSTAIATYTVPANAAVFMKGKAV